MAKNRGATFAKRARERAQQEKREAKSAERTQRRGEKKEKGPLAPGEDPDIAGIRPGPQPKAEEDE
jgi:hypothetical protein